MCIRHNEHIIMHYQEYPYRLYRNCYQRNYISLQSKLENKAEQTPVENKHGKPKSNMTVIY